MKIDLHTPIITTPRCTTMPMVACTTHRRCYPCPDRSGPDEDTDRVGHVPTAISGATCILHVSEKEMDWVQSAFDRSIKPL